LRVVGVSSDTTVTPSTTFGVLGRFEMETAQGRATSTEVEEPEADLERFQKRPTAKVTVTTSKQSAGEAATLAVDSDASGVNHSNLRIVNEL
jgi:hypothetical protein